jgi:hypothetical protein
VKFDTLGGIFSYYHEVRASMYGARTNMPDSEALRLEVMGTPNPMRARSSMEYRKALIGDIQLYVKKQPWHDQYLLMGRLRPPGEAQISFNRIVALVRELSSGRTIPWQYRDRANLRKHWSRVIRPLAEDYFRERGYLR